MILMILAVLLNLALLSPIALMSPPPAEEGKEASAEQHLQMYTPGAKHKLGAYRAFGTERVRADAGVGLYFPKAQADARLMGQGEKRRLEFTWTMDSFFPWGNWISLRYVPEAPFDLSSFQGIDVELEVVQPTPHATLRFTLTDGPVRRDEMWWFDLKPSFLYSATNGVISVRAPFNEFRLASGEGTRHNDGKFVRSIISGVEVNVISHAGQTSTGTMRIAAIRAYR